MAFFNCNTIHGSNPNCSAERRFALVNDYTPAQAQQSRSMGSGQLVRGENRFDHWGIEPIPIGNLEQDAQARRDILNQYPENVLMGPLESGQLPAFADKV